MRRYKLHNVPPSILKFFPKTKVIQPRIRGFMNRIEASGDMKGYRINDEWRIMKEPKQQYIIFYNGGWYNEETDRYVKSRAIGGYYWFLERVDSKDRLIKRWRFERLKGNKRTGLRGALDHLLIQIGRYYEWEQ